MDTVFLPIGRSGHWSLATADTRTRTRYHDSSRRSTQETQNRNGATVLKRQLTELEKHLGINNDISDWTCHSSADTQLPQQPGIIDCGVFVCAFASLRQQGIPCVLFHLTHNQRMRLYMAYTILTTVLLLLSSMVCPNTHNNNKYDTSTSKKTDRPEDALTGGGFGHKRHTTELIDNTEKKRTKVTKNETVSTMAKRRRRLRAVTKINRKRSLDPIGRRR